jgi:transcriptional regulator with XRE-family HTH domain
MTMIDPTKLTVKQLRNLVGLTQEGLAKLYGVRNGQYVANYLDKKTLAQLREPYEKKLARLDKLQQILTEGLEK